MINAVHQRDVKAFLARLGLLEDLERGKLKCDICDCQITEENIGTIFKFEGNLRVCCNRADCLKAVVDKVRVATP